MEFKAASNYAWLLMVVLSVSSLAGVVADTNTVPSELCKDTPEPDFCEEMVNGANTGLMATYRAIKLTVHVCRQVHISILKFIKTFPKDMPPQLKNTTIGICNKDFDQAISNYVSAIECLDSGNLEKLNSTLSNIPMENCIRKIGDIVANPGVASRVIDKLHKYAEYTRMIAQNVIPHD